ncbi:lysine 2,3-aminomutase [Carboxylicivirga sp. N1Y90]|uniref:lysine 2,3-aminomutase n=1 Tax=Carboxylicivirga fragile TaxID=3417571 RepID=UPI003D340135|nr:lysine 2,3-aminomutase [Marinilabiliaceae bacterium N1Y90]
MKIKFSKVDYKSIPLFKDVSVDDWNNWKWQMRNAIRDIPTLEKVLELSEEEREHLSQTLGKFKMAITPYYAALMDKEDRECPVRKLAVPILNELHIDESDLSDPLHEDVDSPVPGLTHRYPDRALLLVTHECSMYCRHCTRRRIVGETDEEMGKGNLEKAFEYIANTPEIRDVVISGGDPLILSNNRIDYILTELRKIEHVEVIRIGSRMPVVLPQRITDELCNIIKKHHPVYVNTHFNHPKEITDDAREACEKLANCGVQLGNQSVLLKGVNDCSNIMKSLMHNLLRIRVKPYYIYQCDLSEGISHFRTTISKGIEIIENLRGHTSGMAVPTFVVDAPGGGGKIPVMPDYLISQTEKRVVLRNYEGMITSYTQPSDYQGHKMKDCDFCNDESLVAKDGVAKLLNEGGTIRPQSMRREIRTNGNGKH